MIKKGDKFLCESEELGSFYKGNLYEVKTIEATGVLITSKNKNWSYLH